MTQDDRILKAARALVRIWRSPDPELWRHVDDGRVVDAIEALCAVVENERKPE